MSITIRDAVSSDTQTILDFIIELAIYEKEPNAVKTNVEETREKIFGKNSSVKALICEEDGVAIGHAIYFLQLFNVAWKIWYLFRRFICD